MKKLLLSLATVALAAGFTASADTATWDFNQEDAYGLTTFSSGSNYETSVKSLKDGDVSLEFSGNYRLWKATSRYELRVMKNATVTVSVPEGAYITEIAVEGNKANKFTSNPEVTASGTSASATYSFTTKPESIVLTASDRVDVTGLTVTYTPAENLSGKESAGLEFAVSSVTYGKNEFFVLPTLTNPHDLPVTYTSSNPEILAVTDYGADSDPAWRWGFTIKGVVGTATLTATTEETDVYAAGKATVKVNVVNMAGNVAQMFEYAPAKGNKILLSPNLTFTVSAFAKSGNNCYVYVTDLWENATLLFGYDLNYKKGDQIPGGWEAENAEYNGLPEWKGSFPAATSCFPEFVNYQLVETVTEADLNKVVNLSGVVLEAASPDKTNTNQNVTLADGTTLVFRNTFMLESVEPGTYDVIGAVAIYNGTLQFYPLEYNEHVVYPTFPENIEVTSDAKSCSSSLAEESGYLNLTINMTTENDEATFTIATPEGYDCVYVMMYPEYGGGDDDFGGFLRNSAPASWVNPAEYGFESANPTVTVKADGEEHYGQFYLGFNGKLDAANSVDITVKATKSGSTGVEAVEVAEGEAVYYNLQGVEVVNPEKGVYVKVLNGKAEKVVL